MNIPGRFRIEYKSNDCSYSATFKPLQPYHGSLHPHGFTVTGLKLAQVSKLVGPNRDPEWAQARTNRQLEFDAQISEETYLKFAGHASASEP
jgi:hypothetical protein